VSREVEEVVKIISVAQHNQAACGLPAEDGSGGDVDVVGRCRLTLSNPH